MKKLLFNLLFIFLSTGLVAQVSNKEEQALLDIFVALNGENWVHVWDINKPVKNWHGVTVKNNKVTEVKLLFNNLEGNLPSSIGNLENLKYLELSFNKISGNVPPQIGLLSNLEFFAINGNYLEGPIPPSLGSLTSLKELHLSSNKLSGKIPSTLSNLSDLEVFNVFDNSIGGQLPFEFSHSKKLRKVVIAKNNIAEDKALSAVIFFDSSKSNNFKTSKIPKANTVIASETSDDN
jgi:hypothetical protein